MSGLISIDLCDEVDAEERCLGALNRGLEIDQENPGLHISYASFSLSTHDREGALRYAMKAYTLSGGPEFSDCIGEMAELTALVKILIELNENDWYEH